MKVTVPLSPINRHPSHYTHTHTGRGCKKDHTIRREKLRSAGGQLVWYKSSSANPIASLLRGARFDRIYTAPCCLPTAHQEEWARSLVRTAIRTQWPRVRRGQRLHQDTHATAAAAAVQHQPPPGRLNYVSSHSLSRAHRPGP